MRIILVTALLLVSWLVIAAAGPLPKYSDNESSEQSSESKFAKGLKDTSINSESADQSNQSAEKAVSGVNIIKNGDGSNESADTDDEDLTIIKRSLNIPNVDLCSDCVPDAEKKNSHEMHDEYLRYKLQQTRFRRDESGENSSEDNSSEKEGRAKGASVIGANEKAAKSGDAASQKRYTDGDETSEEISEGKGALGAAVIVNAASVKDAARRKRQVNISNNLENSSSEERHRISQEEAIQVAVSEDEKENSLEDYAQGCEVNEVSSYEANETTYNEDRRKRSPEIENSSGSNRESTDDEGQVDTNESADNVNVKDEVSPIVNEGSVEISKENVSEELDGSDDNNRRTKRSTENSKESNSKSNEDSKEENKKGGQPDKRATSAKEDKPTEAVA